MFYLVSYDICDAGRLRRISSLLRRYGTRVQKSVFECRINNSLYCQLLHELDTLCCDQDSVLVYGNLEDDKKISIKKYEKTE